MIMIMLVCPKTFGPLKGGEYIYKVLKFLHLSPDLDVNTFKLKLQACAFMHFLILTKRGETDNNIFVNV